ncbi:MAG: LLM class flavin-dependent oxidoreductase, partial [Mycobacterium sp.]|nr:LLM class flavin-dependent oxidoreductase [Mycobacterium sp.]
MKGISRRSFGQLVTGASVVGAAGLAAACGTRQPAGSPSTPAAPPPPSGPAVGFVLSHEQFTTAQLVDQAQAAEQAGFRYLWASDHLQPWQDNEGHSMFPWITLALVGQRTKHIPFGTGVTCP